MNTLNLNAGITSTKSLTKALNNIVDTCNQLHAALQDNIGDMADYYGGGVTEKVMNTEFVDEIIRSLLLIKHHVNDIKKYFKGELVTQTNISTLVEHLLHTADKLKLAMINNRYFHNHFGYMVMEISEAIDELLKETTIKA